MIIQTQRLILRQWCMDNLAPMAAINQDPKVMEFFPAIRTYIDTENFIEGNIRLYEKYGYCLYAAELKNTQEFIGFMGLNYIDWQSHFTPAIEIGWRLGSQFWGQGYVLEAATAVRDFAFNKLKLLELVSFTVPSNIRSIRLMQRLGFIYNKVDGFANPNLALRRPLRKPILYRLARGRAC